MIPGLTAREERVLDTVWRFHEYGRYRGYGYSKRAARAQAGISRYLVERCEEAEWRAMCDPRRQPADPSDPDDMPF